MQCLICGAYETQEDNFCRRCGASNRNRQLPLKRTPALPSPWRQAAPALAQSVALIAAGLAAEWLLRAAARHALRLPLQALVRPTRPRSKALAPRKESLPEGGVAISETVVMRRVILRR